MEAIGRLAGGVAHDFNNLLTVISSYSALTLDGLEASSPLRADVEEIRAATSRAADLTRQLLAFSRKQMLQPVPLNLNETVDGIDKMLRRLIGEDIELVTSCGADLDLVSADPGQLEQVIVNLAVNARDAMPDGGRLTIETSNVILSGDDHERHLGVPPGRYVMLKIADSGVGMNEETLDRIFEPFFTTKDVGRGTGQGLAIARSIVQRHGGTLTFETGTQGTTFYIRLPIASSPAKAA
jgi:signal transduction histidine kinase